VLFLLIFVGWLEWSENPERTRRWTVFLAGIAAATSVVMGAISLTQMQNYCLFCIALYVLSFIVFFALKGWLREPFWLHFRRDLPVLWTENKGVLVAFALVPIGAYFAHQAFIQNYGAGQINELVRDSLQEWDSAPVQSFVAKPTLVMGPSPEAAAMTLVEFADLKCGHCRHANYSLHAFVKSHPDVRLEFYSFPLDGACNEKIPSSTGLSCRLAESIFCAEKEGKGWELQKTLYDVQEQVNTYNTPAELDPFLSQVVGKLGLNWERVQTCMSDTETKDAVKTQAKQGALVNVRGTPTIFANGKLINRGQIVPVLEGLRSKILVGKH
jgi:protein-disulfide isomerase